MSKGMFEGIIYSVEKIGGKQIYSIGDGRGYQEFRSF